MLSEQQAEFSMFQIYIFAIDFSQPPLSFVVLHIPNCQYLAKRHLQRCLG